MAKMASLHAEGMTDKELNDPYEIPIKYIEEDEWEQTELDGLPDDTQDS
mgnify:CR=1 FL=1|jgi:hypothetical protein